MFRAYAIVLLIAFWGLGCTPLVQPTDEVPPNRIPPGPAISPGSTTQGNLPVQIHEELPEYPAMAQINNIEGTVVILAYVNHHGKIILAEAEKCSHPGLMFEEAAVKAAYKCRYRPAEVDGKDIGCWIRYTVSFELR